ncbi:AAC(3) family N-acetyltransferase [Enterovibrio calviensis]|uniref:AAC(3) family N-acetyltransferase n=1 Tax=Enterovibrio calviensis TaxID=91359 RepID=UPI003735978F
MTNTFFEVKSAIQTLSLNNKVLFVHASIRSLGKLDGGAMALLNAFLDAGCTVIVPAFNYDTLCLPPKGVDYQQNGHRGQWHFEPTEPFDVSSNHIEPSMGAFAAAVVNHPKRLRTDHPINSFAGVGPKAGAILAQQTDADVYGHYQGSEVKDAIVLSIGVTPKSLTPIHCAEQQAGRRLFRRWALTASRGEVEVCIGSCSNGFNQLEDALQPAATKIKVGLSDWTSYSLESLLENCTRAIIENPSITQCDIDCPRCQDMVSGGLIINN